MEQLNEQRDCVRVVADYDAEFRRHGEHAWTIGSVADIGESGVRIRLTEPVAIAPGTNVWLRIQPREAVSKLVVLGSVVRCEPSSDRIGHELSCRFA